MNNKTNPKQDTMTRKFLFCFPLRLGNIVFGYIVIIFALTLMIYHLTTVLLALFGDKELEKKFDPNNSLSVFLGYVYLCAHAVIGFLLFFFATIFTVGVYKLNVCAIMSFFVYSFIHIFLTIGLIGFGTIWQDWPRIGVLVVTDVLLIFCLFSVKYLKDAVQTGKIYHRPDEPLQQY